MTLSADYAARESLTARARRGILGTVAIATFVVTLSTTSLGVAVPAVTRQFRSSSLESTLLVVTPLLVSTVLLLPMGRISDLIGHRRSYLGALAGFTVASMLMAAAPSVSILIAVQACQACAVGVVWANSAAILLESLDTAAFRYGLGLYIAAISVADLLGPTWGGVVTQTLGWRWIFWLQAAVGAGCLLWGRAALTRPTSAARRVRLDGAGFLTLTVGLACMVGGLLMLQGGTGASAPVALCSAGVVVLLCFVALERSRADPLLDFGIFAQPRIVYAVASSALNALAQWVPSLLLVLFFQAYDGKTPLEAGLIVMPLPVVSGACSLLMGRLARICSPDLLAVGGSALAFCGLAAMPWALAAPYPALIPALAFIGAGSGVFSPAIADVMLEGVGAADSGAANGTRLTAQNVGWVVGTALALAVATAHLDARERQGFFAGRVHELSAAAARLLLTGYRSAFLVLMAAALAASVLAYLAVRHRGQTVATRGTSASSRTV